MHCTFCKYTALCSIHVCLFLYSVFVDVGKRMYNLITVIILKELEQIDFTLCLAMSFQVMPRVTKDVKGSQIGLTT